MRESKNISSVLRYVVSRTYTRKPVRFRYFHRVFSKLSVCLRWLSPALLLDELRGDLYRSVGIPVDRDRAFRDRDHLRVIGWVMSAALGLDVRLAWKQD